MIANADSIQELILLGDLFDFWTYPPNFTPPATVDIINANPNIFGATGKFSQALTASVKGFSEYFQVEQVNSFCLLPLYHVSGLMQFLRSFLTEGDFAVISYHKIKQKRINNLNLQDYFISLVPTQLQFFLENDPQWLTNFKTVLLGGSPAWPSLLEKAREYNISLSPTK